MQAKLYVILGSHACRTGMLMLDHKGIAYETVELPPMLHPFLLRLRGFSGKRASFRSLDGESNFMLGTADRMGTVPSLLLDGERVRTNYQIARFLERTKPDPPLFPADPERRQAVEEAERWGDETLQMVARRLGIAGALHGPDFMAKHGNDGRLGPLLWRNETVRRLGVRTLGKTVFRANRQTESELLASLPAMLDRIDDWIEAGTLNGEELYAADFVIAPCLALLCYRSDVEPEIRRRPAIALLDRLLPEPGTARTAYPSGHVSQHSHAP
jgi:glutathione S-transferase